MAKFNRVPHEEPTWKRKMYLSGPERIFLDEVIDFYWEEHNAHHPDNEYEYAQTKRIKRMLRDHDMDVLVSDIKDDKL